MTEVPRRDWTEAQLIQALGYAAALARHESAGDETAVGQLLAELDETGLHGPLIFGLVGLVNDYGEQLLGSREALHEHLTGTALRCALHAVGGGRSDL